MRPGPVVVEVYADVCCPFTHVGLRRFVERREATGRDGPVLRVRAWPLEIVNGAPLQAAFVAEEVDALRSSVAGDLFAAFDPSRFPASSLPAFALAAAGYRRDLATGEAVSLALRDLLFEQGEDISDPSVLGALARRLGVQVTGADPASVEVDHRDGAARGVIGSPHFFPPEGSFFCPALDISRDADGRLLVAADESGFERFLDACFA